jgi:hypothetical protein
MMNHFSCMSDISASRNSIALFHPKVFFEAGRPPGCGAEIRFAAPLERLET